MTFLIADTFSDSLARLTGEEQKAVKTAAFDLQMNPAKPGLSFHKLDKARDKNFASVRVNADIRLIVHRTPGSLLLCYVDHHDRAYAWAARRKMETHPKTGAAQIVEVRELVREVVIPVHTLQVKEPPPKPRLFATIPEADLLGYGVPLEWMEDVRQADEDSLLVLADRLPAEAAEALLEIATGGRPRIPAPVPVATPFEHPDAQRRFRVMTNVEELERALDYPWERWTIYLHPEQRQWVECDYSGPARVSGSAGTGKTIVALHRAVHLARQHPDARILLTTFSDTLANALRTKLRRLVGNEPKLAERIDVHSLDALGGRLYKAHHGALRLASRDDVRDLLREALEAAEGHRFTLQFLLTEWEQVVDAWQLGTWEAYRDVVRLGRRTRLPESRRVVLWGIFERVQAALKAKGLLTSSALFTMLAATMEGLKSPPFDFSVIDEAQDISVSQLRFFAAMGGNRPNALFFAGDLGQRIFQQPFPWKTLGVDIRGRSRTLRINYRTSHQIRRQADRLLDPELSDADGNREGRGDTISVFNGPPPEILTFKSEEDESAAVGAWLKKQAGDGLLPHEMGVFVRSDAQLVRARRAVEQAGLPFTVLDDRIETIGGKVAVSTMHLAKGLEFRAVAVMACDDEIIPLQARIETVGDEADLQEVYDTERHLLYVACTRARDRLLVTSVDPASEFLDDLNEIQPHLHS